MAAQHAYRPGNQWGVTVPELIERIAAEGFPTRLRWPDTDTGLPYQLVRWSVDDYPTGYLPKIIRDMHRPEPVTRTA
ncbi:hypothetical protein [Gandjariella thermophila]|uniref:Uncharacterized protein n=1 Tax=Gandjariella thermophila TaxID=1931992 RepID=A0A4D4JBL6_9PSEU|nr:hypothetical protein [Gandjariella thermophila]GDY32058.1 hypothetical protein GTS_36910 [Gandjariella thermophila]